MSGQNPIPTTVATLTTTVTTALATTQLVSQKQLTLAPLAGTELEVATDANITATRTRAGGSLIGDGIKNGPGVLKSVNNLSVLFLTTSNTSALTTANIGALYDATCQLGALTTTYIASLSTSQIIALTPTNIAAISYGSEGTPFVNGLIAVPANVGQILEVVKK
jgi:hypothetical protein